MKTLQGKDVFLRALEPEDLQLLYLVENNETVWEVSNTTTPFSKYILQQYLENSHRDIYEVKQLRLVICVSETEEAIGFIDLFDFEPKHRRVGVGIVIFSEKERRKGYALQSLQLLCSYTFSHLNVHQVYAHITFENKKSIFLFEKAGFIKTGTKKDWIFSEGIFKDELVYQLFQENVH